MNGTLEKWKETWNCPIIFLIIYLIMCLGHQALINQVSFSPDGRLIASAAFDKSVKIWNGDTGKLVAVCSVIAIIYEKYPRKLNRQSLSVS